MNREEVDQIREGVAEYLKDELPKQVFAVRKMLGV